MNENKTGRYFKYAIGEIILVVVGILIALQINNWNENRKALAEEEKILELLQEDLVTAKITCQKLLDSELKNIRTYETFLGNPKGQNLIVTSPKADSLFFRILWGVGESQSEISAITEIQNSGNTSKIRNRTIRKQITALDTQLKAVENIVKDRLNVQQISLDKFSLNLQNFRKLIVGTTSEYNIDFGPENDYRSLINDPNILNAVAMKLDLSDSVIADRKLLIIEIDKLLDLIDKEL